MALRRTMYPIKSVRR